MVPLSPMQKKVAQMICNGLKGKEIAEELNIKLGTVKAHAGLVYVKTGARGRLELAVMVVKKEVEL